MTRDKNERAKYIPESTKITGLRIRDYMSGRSDVSKTENESILGTAKLEKELRNRANIICERAHLIYPKLRIDEHRTILLDLLKSFTEEQQLEKLSLLENPESSVMDKFVRAIMMSIKSQVDSYFRARHVELKLQRNLFIDALIRSIKRCLKSTHEIVPVLLIDLFSEAAINSNMDGYLKSCEVARQYGAYVHGRLAEHEFMESIPKEKMKKIEKRIRTTDNFEKQMKNLLPELRESEDEIGGAISLKIANDVIILESIELTSVGNSSFVETEEVLPGQVSWHLHHKKLPEKFHEGVSMGDAITAAGVEPWINSTTQEVEYGKKYFVVISVSKAGTWTNNLRVVLQLYCLDLDEVGGELEKYHTLSQGFGLSTVGHSAAFGG
jgi:hypothetical protein